VTFTPRLPSILAGQPDLHPVVSYYDRTWVDYRLVWLNERDLAIHFGYHDGRVRSHSESLINTNRVLADLAGIKPGDRVLDAGCGIAGSGVWLTENRGATVVGITPVRSQVDRARARIRKRNLHRRLTVEQADYVSTGFADASFDVVWALESVCHARSKASFYRESARLLRPGGRLVMAEYIRAKRVLPEADEKLLADWLGGWMIPDLDTREEHLAHALDAGFTDVELNDVTLNMRKSLRRLYILSLAGVPVDRVLRRLGLRGDVLHGNVVGSRRQYEALRRNCWFYGMISAVRS